MFKIKSKIFPTGGAPSEAPLLTQERTLSEVRIPSSQLSWGDWQKKEEEGFSETFLRMFSEEEKKRMYPRITEKKLRYPPEHRPDPRHPSPPPKLDPALLEDLDLGERFYVRGVEVVDLAVFSQARISALIPQNFVAVVFKHATSYEFQVEINPSHLGVSIPPEEKIAKAKELIQRWARVKAQAYSGGSAASQSGQFSLF